IEQPSLLLAANVVDASNGSSPACFNDSSYMRLIMHVDYTNASFGNWGQTISLFGGLPTLFFPAPDPHDLLGGESWAAAPADYWDLYSLDALKVSEPGHWGLIVLGFGSLMLAVVRRYIPRT